MSLLPERWLLCPNLLRVERLLFLAIQGMRCHLVDPESLVHCRYFHYSVLRWVLGDGNLQVWTFPHLQPSAQFFFVKTSEFYLFTPHHWYNCSEDLESRRISAEHS